MRRIVLIIVLLVVAGAAASVPWWLTHRHKTAQELTLYGNIDLRQVELAFNNSERIAEVLVQEGDHVRRGQVLARLDTRRLEPQVAQTEAQAAAQRQIVERLRHGSRPEEIAEAAARLQAAEAQLAFLQQQLADAQLVAPVNGIMRTRLMEPGEMASPQKPVFSLAVTDPKWVRAYVSEPDLGKVSPGMVASVVVDSFPERRFEGWVGFISPVAEFTPKAVQTQEL